MANTNRARYNKPVIIDLGLEDRRALRDLTKSPGFAVLLKVMEVHCILQDNEMLKVPTWTDKVKAVHAITVAKWQFFGTIRKQIEIELQELEHHEREGRPLNLAEKKALIRKREIDKTVTPFDNGE